MSLHYSVLFLVVVLSGCATSVFKQDGMGATTVVENQSPQPAWAMLLNKAVNARNKGNLDKAASDLSRAMRMKPAEPQIYYQMALLRQLQEKPENAKQLAIRALSLSPDEYLTEQIRSLLKTL
ncbi:hypothetical protein CI610_02060 [invertebrate metagenome]|uniref:Uncharacterized protein n=1 Tax=invertebrate metagenome TaxID=1711999 RepID=A0A2H9T708_9ZZZZ